MDADVVVGKLEEIIQNVKSIKEESDAKGREWAIAHRKLQEALAWIKTYCVEEEE